jgi:hypothetical protein
LAEAGFAPDDLPADTATVVRMGDSTPRAVGVVLGHRELESLRGRTDIEWEQDDRHTTVRKLDNRGVLVSTPQATTVEVHLDADALTALRVQGVVSWQAGGSDEGPYVTVVGRDG